MHTELNTGVVYFRCTGGSLAMVQTWRKAMLQQKGRQDLTENVNDQSLFNQVVTGGELRGGDTASWVQARAKELSLPAAAAKAAAAAPVESATRRVYRSHNQHPPCLPGESCEPVAFTFGTLPMRPFTGGHTWFNQNVQQMEGHETPQFEPITVHFTFQFSDTGDYPHVATLPFYELTRPRWRWHFGNCTHRPNGWNYETCCDCTHFCYSPSFWHSHIHTLKTALVAAYQRQGLTLGR